jgi:hypothetical protein
MCLALSVSLMVRLAMMEESREWRHRAGSAGNRGPKHRPSVPNYRIRNRLGPSALQKCS